MKHYDSLFPLLVLILRKTDFCGEGGVVHVFKDPSARAFPFDSCSICFGLQVADGDKPVSGEANSRSVVVAVGFR